MAGIHRRDSVVAPQAEVHRIRETRSVGVERAAKPATASHVELPVPTLERQPNFEVDGGSHEAEHTAVGWQIACCAGPQSPKGGSCSRYFQIRDGTTILRGKGWYARSGKDYDEQSRCTVHRGPSRWCWNATQELNPTGVEAASGYPIIDPLYATPFNDILPRWSPFTRTIAKSHLGGVSAVSRCDANCKWPDGAYLVGYEGPQQESLTKPLPVFGADRLKATSRER